MLGLTEQDELKDQQKQEKDAVNEVTNEGYLNKQSLYLKKFKNRYVILRENHLFCYDNHKKTKIIEFIKLASFETVKLSNTELNQFELIPKNEKEKIIVFEAKSLDEAQEWISYLHCSMNGEDMTQNINDEHTDTSKEMGMLYLVCS